MSELSGKRGLPAGHALGYQRAISVRQKGRHLFADALINVISYLIHIIIILVIVQFVLSLLITFNVVNTHNQFVAAIWTAVNALLDPILSPVRKIMPNTGAIDFSPLVLIIGLNILVLLLEPFRGTF